MKKKKTPLNRVQNQPVIYFIHTFIAFVSVPLKHFPIKQTG